MNRQARRAFERRLQTEVKTGTLKHPAPDSVVLAGGPMDGWVVKPDAPALRPDWHRTWPPTIAARHAPGHYAAPVRDGRIQRSTWQASA